eukprot:2843764-Heterocapsa_arctica.AAC.1
MLCGGKPLQPPACSPAGAWLPWTRPCRASRGLVEAAGLEGPDAAHDRDEDLLVDVDVRRVGPLEGVVVHQALTGQ